MYVNVNYLTNDISSTKDDRFIALAKLCRGVEAGGGTDFKSRDVSFTFRSAKNAGHFIDRVKRFKCVDRIDLCWERV